MSARHRVCPTATGRRVALLAIVALAAAGCPKGNEDLGGAAAASNPRRLITQTPVEDGLVRVDVDLDGDGRPDVMNFQRPRAGAAPLIVRKETDLNRDGRVDVRSFFGETGQIDREEMDGDFDGTFDWVDHYQGGRRVMSEVDTDYDGSTNIWSYYDGNVITRQERDEDGNGLVDYWIRFDAEGNAVRTARDLDGDGKMDVRDE